ncbi:UbiD family decarboxylase domain-containing protein [Actinosynnema sp. CS-041913]|uniref:UbiD family decarboxylase domain-containing protein n=1 Tax=Actinosynnema sp. CS-041913 TaxID=3239917 RepID=UPI003D8F2D6D
MTPISVRDALATFPDVPEVSVPLDQVARHFARHHAGIPASSSARPEPAVLYRPPDADLPVLLGLYGSADRVRDWLPGLPGQVNAQTVAAVFGKAVEPSWVENRREPYDGDLSGLPVLRTTPRDAGPYVTLGLVHALDPDTGATALSAHRMLVLGPDRLGVWMVPGRALRAMHEATSRRRERLPVSVNIGAPPAAVIASALTTTALAGRGKLALAGALAGTAVTLTDAVTQPVPVLADAEITLEGYLDHTTADETLGRSVGPSMPEFLGYDGGGQPDLPVLTVTGITVRPDPVYQAVIGPGREQSVILGTAGELSVAAVVDQDWDLIADLHHTPAGGGMLTLVVAVRRYSPRSEGRLKHIARRLFDGHPFLKLIVFTDTDVDIRCAEDVLWAITTRCNLATDAMSYGGYRPLRMDPSQTEPWVAERGRDGGSERSFIDATVPYRLRRAASRSYGLGLDGVAR